MCVLPKAPKIPPVPERQAVQAPRDDVNARTSLSARRRRGMWAAIMTGPNGIAGAPKVTGTSAGTLGG